MTRIDFLPEKYHHERSAHRTRIWALALLAMFGGVIAATSLLQFKVKRSVRRQVLVVDAMYVDAESKTQRLLNLQARLKLARTTARLHLYLRHPWPCTQILAAVVEGLPDSVSISELRLAGPATKTGKPRSGGRVRPSRRHAVQQEVDSVQPPAQRDLQHLRNESGRGPTVVYLTGVTQDTSSLHQYVSEIGRLDLIAKVELGSIESIESDSEFNGTSNMQNASRFQIRLIVETGYEHPNGPRQPLDAGPGSEVAKRGGASPW